MFNIPGFLKIHVQNFGFFSTFCSKIQAILIIIFQIRCFSRFLCLNYLIPGNLTTLFKLYSYYSMKILKMVLKFLNLYFTFTILTLINSTKFLGFQMSSFIFLRSYHVLWRCTRLLKEKENVKLKFFYIKRWNFMMKPWNILIK